MTNRGGAVELAVLGLLHESPMHGYELRKRVTGLLGWGRVLSYGSLYPALKQMRRTGWLTEDTTVATARRGKIVYRLTVEGERRFEELMAHGGPSAWEDDSFGVHFAFFAKTDAETRMRILEGRRSRLEERLERVRTSFARSRERVDAYTLELQRHGLESVEREVSWLSDLIDKERSRHARAVRRSAQAHRDRRRKARSRVVPPPEQDNDLAAGADAGSADNEE
ncbi:MAG: PadR family transcriptional regulator [Nocardioidaceae bacterium]